MRHKLLWFHARTLKWHWHFTWPEAAVSLLAAVAIFISPASAAMRLQERSLFIQTSQPGATTAYTISFRYMSPQSIGSVDLLFCVDPIPYHPCVTPAGLNAAGATLADQQGETGYSISSRSTNHVVLSRIPHLVTSPNSSYTLDNIVNPTDVTQAFSVRIQTHSSSDASGPQVDFGTVRSEINTPIEIESQVPPQLIFCLAQEVADNCTSTNETYYTDMGDLSAQSTLTAQSQMAVGTNASGGFAITAVGTPLSAGTNVIDGPKTPTASKPGTNQFGINLVENTAPAIGKDPEGTWANAVPSPDYAIPDKYKYTSGDVVAFSPNVSLMKKFTVSYIVNTSKDLRAGVYTTTITYIASGRF